MRRPGAARPPSRRTIFVCRAARPAQEPACARTILTSLAHRAFRRPVTSADVEPLYAFYQKGRATGRVTSKPASRPPSRRCWCRRNFCSASSGISGQRRQRRRIASATSSSRRVCRSSCGARIPDAELLDLAERGKLKDAAVLERQVRRMLDDPRADALVSNFAGQWLHLRNVETVKPDPVIFPFDEALRQSFLTETALFVSSIFREDRSLLDLLSADYTFVNQRLAEHYGIPRVYGSQFRRVTLTDANRHGLLGQGSVLTVTSYPNRTSVVQRGKWILENLLGTPPPPPPPDVPELKAAPARQGAVDARADAGAPGQRRLRGVPRPDGPDWVRARELRRRRAVARRGCGRGRSTRAGSCRMARSSRGRPGSASCC